MGHLATFNADVLLNIERKLAAELKEYHKYTLNIVLCVYPLMEVTERVNGLQTSALVTYVGFQCLSRSTACKM